MESNDTHTEGQWETDWQECGQYIQGRGAHKRTFIYGSEPAADSLENLPKVNNEFQHH